LRSAGDAVFASPWLTLAIAGTVVASCFSRAQAASKNPASSTGIHARLAMGTPPFDFGRSYH
jgi:hypothetical protein